MALANLFALRDPVPVDPTGGFGVRPGITVTRLLLCTAALLWFPGDSRSASGSLHAADAPPSGPTLTAKLETLTLKSGETFSGWVKQENDAHLWFTVLDRPLGGSPTLKTQRYLRTDVEKVDRLDKEARLAAERSVAQWLREVRRAATAKIKPAPTDVFSLQKTRTLGPPTWEYHGANFKVQSTSDEATVRAVAMRLEERWTALASLIPASREPEAPLRIVIWGSSAEYEAQLRALGASLSHRAFFAPADHLIVARTDLGRIGEEVEKIKQEHAQMLADFKRQVEELRHAQKSEQKVLATRGASDREIAEYQRLRGKQLRDEQQLISERIATSEKRNDELLVELADRTFRDLYHEVFHAYLESRVFPQNRFDVPLWMNEGLAQVFETARIAGGQVVKEASPARRDAAMRLAPDLLGPTPLSLADLLRADRDKFLHVAALGATKDRKAAAEAARHYLYAWGLADYLTYRKNLVGPSRCANT